VVEAETCCHLVTLNKINIHNTSCVLTCEYLLLICYQYSLRKNPEERSFHLLCGGSLKSRIGPLLLEGQAGRRLCDIGEHRLLQVSSYRLSVFVASNNSYVLYEFTCCVSRVIVGTQKHAPGHIQCSDMWLPAGVVLHSCVVSVALVEEVTNIVQGYEMLKFTSAHTRLRPTTVTVVSFTHSGAMGRAGLWLSQSVRHVPKKVALFQGLCQTYFISEFLHCSTCSVSK
jgi:hypothetical protein